MTTSKSTVSTSKTGATVIQSKAEVKTTPAKTAQVPKGKKETINPFAQTLGQIQAAAKAKTTAKEQALKGGKVEAKQIVKDVTKGVQASGKPATKPLSSAPEVKSLCKVNHGPTEYARPSTAAADPILSSTKTLKAFTAAWLELFGLMNGAQQSRGTLKAICGTTAIDYHTKIGNFEIDSKTGKMQLTAHGLNFFNNRKLTNQYDEKVKEIYKHVMMTGEPDGVYIKNKTQLIKYCA